MRGQSADGLKSALTLVLLRTSIVLRIRGNSIMSDIASLGRLKPSSAQLPVSWYLDPEIFALEKKLLFDAGPNYVGHELMVPNAGDYHALAWLDNAQVLCRKCHVAKTTRDRRERELLRVGDEASAAKARWEADQPARDADLAEWHARKAAWRARKVASAGTDG